MTKRSTNFQRRAPANGLLGRAALELERVNGENTKLRRLVELLRAGHTESGKCDECVEVAALVEAIKPAE